MSISNNSPIYGQLRRWFQRQFEAKGSSWALREAVAQGTTIGTVRDINQDRTAVFDLRTSGDAMLLAGVLLADGVGGGASGDVAASIASASFIEAVTDATVRGETNAVQNVLQALSKSNERVFEELSGDGACTLTGVFFPAEDFAVTFHVGDSRLYVSDKSSFKQVTVDDNLVTHLRIAKDDDRYGQSHFNQLTRYIGMDPSAFEPAVNQLEINADSRLVVTSDGVHGVLEDQMFAVVMAAPSLKVACSRLVEMSEWCGSRDNASIVIAEIRGIIDRFSRTAGVRLLASANLLEVWDAFGQLQILAGSSQVKNLVREDQPDEGSVPTGSSFTEARHSPEKAQKKKRLRKQRSGAQQEKLPEVEFR